MAFVAECPFCRTKVRVPDESEGMSLNCPRCADSFTVARMEFPPVVTEQKLRPPPTAASAAAAVLTAVHKEETPNPETPALISLEGKPWRRGFATPWELLGGTALLLAAAAMALASLREFHDLSLRLSAGAMAVGVIGWLAAAKPDRGGRLRPALGFLLGLVTFGIVEFWPALIVGPPLGDNTPRPLGSDVPAMRVVEPTEAAGSMDAQIPMLSAGSLRVRILSVALAPAEKSLFGQALGSSANTLRIALRVYNGNADHSQRFESWSQPLAGDKACRAELLDGEGRSFELYSPVVNSGQPAPERVKNIPPLSHIDEQLVFAYPPGTPVPLVLELPLAAVGAGGSLHSAIPASSIRLP